jgi:hypothetical protein
MKEKYVFMKGDRIRHLGGKFIVIPSVTDFSIETIFIVRPREYVRVYGEDGFRMADGTHKITKYDMTFVFWMVIDCLLKSKFVGYTANFTENSDAVIDGADVFFQHKKSGMCSIGQCAPHCTAAFAWQSKLPAICLHFSLLPIRCCPLPYLNIT